MNNEFVKYTAIGALVGVALVLLKNRGKTEANTTPNLFGADFPTQVVDKGSLAFGQDYVDNYAKDYADRLLNDYMQEHRRSNALLEYEGNGSFFHNPTGQLNNI